MEMAIDRKGHENELSPAAEGNNGRRPVRDGPAFNMRRPAFNPRRAGPGGGAPGESWRRMSPAGRGGGVISWRVVGAGA
jgi:hypothetical protein